MKTSYILLAGSAMASALCFASDGSDAGAGGSTEEVVRKTLKIGNDTFEVKQPYDAGHTVNEAEASTLNQTFLENVRNNVASKIKSAREAFVKGGGAEADFSLDTFMVGEGDAQVTLRQSLTDYADGYEFGIRVGRTAEPVDPVQREARTIARGTLDEAIKAAGGKKKDLDDEAYEQALNTLAARDDIVKEAQRRVKQRESIGKDGLDLNSLLGKTEGAGEPAAA